ncbi:MAG: T9SS type A sorting domain-containing protein [Rhodothermales bacterium]|nr:T9SS type A sorting domain-containing protein [Rhodothermales bacterium]
MAKTISAAALMLVAAVVISTQVTPVPTTLNDFFLAGSQPGTYQIEATSKCESCHASYGQEAVEPFFNWQGSMMAQAARDPLFYACLAIANQDAPESGDYCIRCHSPSAWLEGRSTPTDASAFTTGDRQSIFCDVCHRMVKPTPVGTNPYPGDSDYTTGTYPRDSTYLSTLTDIPPASANGMYVVDTDQAKRGPFTDAAARHQFYYSPYHQDAAICGTCHDVSNPVYDRQAGDDYGPNTFDAPPTDFSPYAMFPVERTYSEWLNSDYNTPTGVYAPQFGGNKDYVSTCQDCHMKDVTGQAAKQNDAVHRTDLPLHDFTGGNTFVPLLIEAAFPGEADTVALNAAVARAADMLQKAATLTVTVTPSTGGYEATVRVQNETGHKLPSGYPEGRRVWIHLKATDASETTVYESGHYDDATAVLTLDDDIKVYEIKPGISTSLSPTVSLPAGPSFHFVLNDTIYSDNRIPPRGFTNAAFETIQSPPVAYSYADGQFWDDTVYELPATAAQVTATLYYQTLSKEYVEFLRDENVTDDWGDTLYDLWAAHGKSSPVAMATDTELTSGLPVELTEFRAVVEGSTAVLTWTTASELNNAGFEVQQRLEEEFVAVGFVAGAGTSSNPHSYAYRVPNLDPGRHKFRLRQIDIDGRSKYSGVVEVLSALPSAFELLDAYPNPFNPTTTVRLSIPLESDVTVSVTDALGRLVEVLHAGPLEAGRHSVVLDGSGLSSGLYVVRLESPAGIASRTVMLVK